MPGYFVVMNGTRKGPFPRDKLVAAMQAGKVPEAADIIDADSGDIVLRDDLLAPDAGGPPEPTGGVDYGRGSAQGGTVQRKKARPPGQAPNKQPYGTPKQYAAHFHAEEVKEPGISVAALVAAFLCWPLGLILAIMALGKCKELGAPTRKATIALWLSIIWGVLGMARLGIMISKGEL